MIGVELPARSQSTRAPMIELHASIRVWRAMYPGYEIKSVEDA
jgi:hypothetical protein